MDNRKFFALERLVSAAEQVGIDFFESAAALAVFADNVDPDSDLCCVCRAGDLIDKETAEMAHTLMDKFKHASGGEVLYLLGMASLLMHDGAMIVRDYELDDEQEKDASCSDFAMHVGMAIACCAKYADQDKPQRLGGKGRAETYKRKKTAVIDIYTKMDSAHSMSADTAAGEILGRVDLSHRKIADTIREYRKMHDAKHNVRDA